MQVAIETWDVNDDLKDDMKEHWHKFAEELFVSCFEIYMADPDKKFTKNKNYWTCIESAKEAENYSLEPLKEATELLMKAWRLCSGWGRKNQGTGGYILEYCQNWIKEETQSAYNNRPEAIELVVRCVSTPNKKDTQRLLELIQRDYLEPSVEELRRQQEVAGLHNKIWRRGKDKRTEKERLVVRLKLWITGLWSKEVREYRKECKEMNTLKKRSLKIGQGQEKQIREELKRKPLWQKALVWALYPPFINTGSGYYIFYIFILVLIIMALYIAVVNV